MKAPAFQWYPKDCDTDENVRGMNDEEFGFYVRCLNHAWLNEGLPADLEEISRILQRPHAKVGRLWLRVGRCFSINEAGRYINSKQEAQRAERKEFVESRRTAAATRWNKQDGCTSNARALHKQCSASASPSASPNTNTSSPDGDGGPQLELVPPPTQADEHLDWFNAWWEIYWRKVSKQEALAAFRKRITSRALFQEVMAATKAQTPAMLAKEAEFRPHGATWLNAERWNDEAPTSEWKGHPLDDPQRFRRMM